MRDEAASAMNLLRATRGFCHIERMWDVLHCCKIPRIRPKWQDDTLLFFCFWFFRTVEWARLTTLIDTLTVEKTTYDMVSHTWKILHTTTTYHHDWVLLKVVSFTSDIRDDFVSIGKTYFCYLSESWVWLLWSTRIHLETDTTTLRSRKWRESLLEGILIELKSRRLTLASRILSFFTDKLVDCSHGRDNK